MKMRVILFLAILGSLCYFLFSSNKQEETISIHKLVKIENFFPEFLPEGFNVYSGGLYETSRNFTGKLAYDFYYDHQYYYIIRNYGNERKEVSIKSAIKINGRTGQVIDANEEKNESSPLFSISYKKNFLIKNNSGKFMSTLDLIFSDDESQCALYKYNNNKLVIYDINSGTQVSEYTYSSDFNSEFPLDGLNSNQRELFLLSNLTSYPQGFNRLQQDLKLYRQFKENILNDNFELTNLKSQNIIGILEKNGEFYYVHRNEEGDLCIASKKSTIKFPCSSLVNFSVSSDMKYVFFCYYDHNLLYSIDKNELIRLNDIFNVKNFYSNVMPSLISTSSVIGVVHQRPMQSYGAVYDLYTKKLIFEMTYPYIYNKMWISPRRSWIICASTINDLINIYDLKNNN